MDDLRGGNSEATRTKEKLAAPGVKIEDLTTARMRDIDMERENAALENLIFNNKNLINTYICGSCKIPTVTVDLNVGNTPAYIPCKNAASCGGWASSEGYKPLQHMDAVDARGIDFEWFRPLTDREVEDLKALARGEQVDAARVFIEPMADTSVRVPSQEPLPLELPAYVVNNHGLLRRPFSTEILEMEEKGTSSC